MSNFRHTPIKKPPRLVGGQTLTSRNRSTKRRDKRAAAETVYTKNFTHKIKTEYTTCTREHHTQPKGILILFLEHLVSAAEADFIPELASGDAPFTPLDSLTPAQTLSAQAKTSNWLKELSQDDDDILDQAQQEKVTQTFNALTTGDPRAKNKLLQLELPEEVQNAIGMVTAYQWKFVEQAEELRSMAISHIVKEVHHPDARIRLKALEMLGKVTEVALFTDRIAVKSEDVTDEELDARIKEKLGKYMGAVDVVATDITEIEDGRDANDSEKTDSAD